MKIKATRKGKHILLNGEKRQLRMATSFGWLGYIRNGQADKADVWLKRMKDIGMDGIRVFGEYADWEGNKFFGAHNIPPLYDVWDWSASHGSAVQITNRNERLLNKAIKLLQKHGMIMEYVVSATAKAMPLPSWYQEHMCRAVSQWFKAYEDEHGATNAYFEIANEYDVTRQDELSNEQINWIGTRWTKARSENPNGDPDYPDSLLGISEGGEEGAGKWDIDYPVSALTHINIHSPRGAKWKNVGPDIKEFLAKYGKPICLNENNHYMEPEQWAEWIPQIPGWASISTKDAQGIIEQAKNAYAAGASVYTLHWMTGMLTNPDLPLTKVERLWKKEFGPTLPDPPDPPDLPDPPEPESWWKRLLRWLFGIISSQGAYE